MANTYVNKIVLSTGETLIDISADTVTADKVLKNYTAHDKSGAPITGSCEYDADTSDATASDSEILATKTAYVNGVKLTGSMTNRGGVTGTITDVEDGYVIPQGYHDGSGTVSIDPTEAAKLDPAKILKDWTVLGVTGTLEPASGVTAQSKSATPTWSAQSILPDSGYDYLSQVDIAAIPSAYVENAAGGYTVTIG